MRKLLLLGCLVAAVASPVSANFVSNGDFSAGMAGWTQWTQRGTFTASVVGGQLDFSDPQSYCGGVYTHVTVPAGATNVALDGYYADNINSAPAADFAEVILVAGHLDYNGLKAAIGGDDLNPGNPDGNYANGEMIYKNDTWATAGGWAGAMDGTSPVVNDTQNGNNPPAVLNTQITGNITLVLKGGAGNNNPSFRWDDIAITPEPTTALLLGLPLFLVRRRR